MVDRGLSNEPTIKSTFYNIDSPIIDNRGGNYKNPKTFDLGLSKINL
jgi:hypothetical protein